MSNEKKKTAVVLIHGIGEQRPMGTLNAFVDVLWKKDKRAGGEKGNQLWSKPDHISGDFELRRLTTGYAANEKRFDFFEFYWAHLMTGTELADVIEWVKRLLFRNPGNVPKRLRKEFYALWCVFLVFIGLVVFAAAGRDIFSGKASLVAVALAGVLLAAIKTRALLPVVGDAARYLSATPRNVIRRTEIRAAGLTLLEKLHQSGSYDRIILVGHSLGTVIGYDLLRFYWARYVKDIQCDGHQRGEFLGLCREVEKLSAELHAAPDDPEAYLAFRKVQSRFWSRIREVALDKEGNPVWLFSDFVTMGSPLAHGDVLLTDDPKAPEADLRAKQAARELPIAPPHLEERQNGLRFSYEAGENVFLHHGAQFACTRWTNIYFPVRMVFYGDVIGGPVRGMFGPGPRDVIVDTKRNGGLFSHTHYWAPYEGDLSSGASVQNYVDAIWRAVNLLDEDEALVWGEFVDKPQSDARDYRERPPYEQK